MSLSLKAADILSARGIQSNELTPNGLMWLLNYRSSMTAWSLLTWGAPLRKKLAVYQPESLRALHLQAVRLQPYGTPYFQLAAYLERSPPRPFYFGAVSRLQSGTELSGLGILRQPSSTAEVVRLTLTEIELDRLHAGESIRYDSPDPLAR